MVNLGKAFADGKSSGRASVAAVTSNEMSVAGYAVEKGVEVKWMVWLAQGTRAGVMSKSMDAVEEVLKILVVMVFGPVQHITLSLCCSASATSSSLVPLS